MEVGLGANRAFDWERYVLFGFVRLAACWWTARAFFGEKCQADCQWSDLKDCLKVNRCDGWVHGSDSFSDVVALQRENIASVHLLQFGIGCRLSICSHSLDFPKTSLHKSIGRQKVFS